MIVCQVCGYQNEDDDTFCGGCPAYLPHSGVQVDDDAQEEAVEDEAAEVEATGLISRVKGMVGMDDAKDVPGDVLVDAEAEREAQEAAERAQQEADEAAAAAERAAYEAAQRREAERAAREEAAERARREQEARAEAEAAAKAQAEAERKAREEAEATARAEAEERERQAAQEQADAEARAKAAREAEAQAQADREARERAEAEAAAAVEAEERARKEAEAQALREAEDRAKAEAEQRARAEQEAAERAAAAAAEREEAQRKAEEEAARRAAEEEEAKRKAEEEARRRAADEEKARVEAEQRAEEERKAAEQAEREAAEAAERARRAAAMVAKPAPAPPRPSRTRGVAAATAATGTIAASTATTPAVGTPAAGTAAGAATGPTALKPTEQRPTAPPPRPPTRKTPPTRKPEPGDQICGQCGEPNRAERKFCRRCANTLADAVVVKRPFWQRIVPRRKPKSVAAGDRPGRTAKGTRKQPLGRRIAKFGRMSVRWLIAGILILGVLGALGLAGPWSDTIQSRLDGAYQSVMNRIRPSYEPANPIEAVASAQARGGGPRRVIDGFDNTHWASGVPVTARPTLELTWAEPTDIARLGILAGGSGDDFRTLARPREIRLLFSDGSRSDLTLKDVADFQTFKVGATQARTVRLLVRSVYPAPDSDAVAITELEFFTRR